MKYIDSEVLALFIWLLFQKKSASKVYSSINSPDDLDSDESDGQMKEFNRKLRETIKENSLEKVLYLQQNEKHDGYIIDVELKSEEMLKIFLKEYLDSFQSDELSGNYFVYDKQLEYIKRELEHYNSHYGKTFELKDEIKAKENLKSSILYGIRIFEFALLLHFHENECWKIINAKKENSQDKNFDISMDIEFLKPINEIFEDLEQKLDKYPYSFEIIENDEYDDKNRNLKGQIRITLKNVETTVIEKECWRNAFEYFTKLTSPTELEISDVIRKLCISSTFARDAGKSTLKRYVTATNKALMHIHHKEKRFLKFKKNKLIYLIPR